MDVWKISETTARKLARDGAEMKRVLHYDKSSSSTLISTATRAFLGLQNEAQRFTPDPAIDSLRPRLIKAWAAAITDPLPPEVEAEALLLLYTQPDLVIEYMGRGRVSNEAFLPAEKRTLFSLDRPGGRRTYLFRRMTHANDRRLQSMTERFKTYREFLLDPTAKIVLSIGGGGFRMFAATSVLKAIDNLLAGDRSRISEVWGSSGGAFLGYVYASGFNANVIDELGYDLYHGRHGHLTDGSIGSLIKTNLRAMARKAVGKRLDPEMAGWLDLLDQKEPAAVRKHARIPFFPVAGNPHRGGALSALSAPEYIHADCADFIYPCDPRDAVAASTAVPGVLRAQRNITGTMSPDQDTWIDGSVTDENPLVLPYIKWCRERERNPDTTPSTLKIVLVNLNLRSSESGVVRKFQALPLLNKIDAVQQLPRVVDMLLDSKTNASIMLLSETGNVEILSLKLVLGTLSANNPRDIPTSIRTGRTFEAWQISTFRRGL
ncbi:MAG: patatin-like phospholipase family protein [Myxococcota bacterium]|nr:patatin-like phospholipase family protein [Myxococcota bacterium]